jgi:hypothetical protein
MKTGRAKMHLEVLEREVSAWLNLPPHKLREWDQPDGWHYYAIEIAKISGDVPLLAGDFVCCLRSALDQLAWALAHLDPERILTLKPGQLKQISFPISWPGDTNYTDRRKLFPPAIADIINTFQPNGGGDTYRKHPLWQLNELWRLDKHVMIPANCQEINILLPGQQMLGRDADGCMVVRAPSDGIWLRIARFKPKITHAVFFGEYMGDFEVSVPRLREIYNFVCDEVIPKFAGFFS